VVPLPCKVRIGRHTLEIGWADDPTHASIWADYEKGELLGEGGYGQVFAARRRSDGEPVAVKELAIFDPNMLERFRREARLCETLEHPNLVRVLEVREEEQGLYQVMELVEGGNDLKDRIAAEGHLPIAEVFHIAESVGKGLQAIHDAGLVHRDIKPANVMRTANGELKIADFGLARPTETGHSLTKPNAGMGTMSYMSPEQALDAKSAGPQSDLYSLGATLYLAVTGALPFPQLKLEDVLRAIDEGEPAPVQGLRPDCPPPLAKVIHRLLARDPDGRYASAKLFLKRLTKARDSVA
jgi:eukaryotic-like serine/threonine-protein kinase